MKYTKESFVGADKYCGMLVRSKNETLRIKEYRANKWTVVDAEMKHKPVKYDDDFMRHFKPIKSKCFVGFYFVNCSTLGHPMYDVAAVAWVDGECRLIARQMMKRDSVAGIIPIAGGSIANRPGATDKVSWAVNKGFDQMFFNEKDAIGLCTVNVYPNDSVDTINSLVNSKFRSIVSSYLMSINKKGKVLNVGRDLKEFMKVTEFYDKLQALMNIVLFKEDAVGEVDSEEYNKFIEKNFNNLEDVTIDPVHVTGKQPTLREKALMKIFIKDSTGQLFLAQYNVPKGQELIPDGTK